MQGTLSGKRKEDRNRANWLNSLVDVGYLRSLGQYLIVLQEAEEAWIGSEIKMLQ